MRWHNFTIRRLLIVFLAVALSLVFFVLPRIREYQWQNYEMVRLQLDGGYQVSIFTAPDQLTPTLKAQEKFPDRKVRSMHFSVVRNGKVVTPKSDIMYDFAPFSKSVSPMIDVAAFYSADRRHVCIASGSYVLLLGDLTKGEFKSTMVIESEDDQTFAPIGSFPLRRYTSIGPIRKRWHALFRKVVSANANMEATWDMPKSLQHY